MFSLKSDLFKSHELNKSEYTKIVGGVLYSAQTHHDTGGKTTYDRQATTSSAWEDSTYTEDSQYGMNLL